MAEESTHLETMDAMHLGEVILPDEEVFFVAPWRAVG